MENHNCLTRLNFISFSAFVITRGALRTVRGALNFIRGAFSIKRGAYTFVNYVMA